MENVSVLLERRRLLGCREEVVVLQLHMQLCKLPQQGNLLLRFNPLCLCAVSSSNTYFLHIVYKKKKEEKGGKHTLLDSI